MEKAQQMFLELKLELLKLILIQAVLDASILFFILYVVFQWILGIYIIPYAIIICFLFIVGYCYWQMRKVNYAYIEEKEPMLRDILRTVYDNMSGKDMMVRALIEELTTRMREVRPGNFFEAKRSLVKLVAIILIAMAIPLVSSYQVQLHDLQQQLPSFTNLIPGLRDPEAPQQDFEDVEFSPTDEIYGDPSVALLGDEEVILEIATSLNNIDFSKGVDDAKRRKFTDQESVNEVYASTDSSYEENIARDRQEIVKAYFKQIQ